MEHKLYAPLMLNTLNDETRQIYLEKMKKAGTDVRCIRYGGVVHATFDRLHYAPQSEDMIDLMAEDLKRL